jgi:hypothetical protein
MTVRQFVLRFNDDAFRTAMRRLLALVRRAWYGPDFRTRRRRCRELKRRKR